MPNRVVKVVNSSEIKGYDHIYDVVSTSAAKYIDENIINDLFNIFHKESKILKINDLSIIKYYPSKIKFLNNKKYSKEEIEIFKNDIYEQLEIPIFELYEYYCEGYIAVKADNYLNIEKIKDCAEKNLRFKMILKYKIMDHSPSVAHGFVAALLGVT